VTSEVNRIDKLIKRRIERNRYDSRLGASRNFFPLQSSGGSQDVERDDRRDNWSVVELLKFYDRQFVQKAYLALLKRDADVEGMTHRLQQLQAGDLSRVELLFRLRYGAEGKEHKVRVSGLIPAFVMEKICRVPVVGVIPAYLRALFRLPRMHRDLEEIRGLIAMQKNDSDDMDRAIVDFQYRELGKIIERFDK